MDDIDNRDIEIFPELNKGSVLLRQAKFFAAKVASQNDDYLERFY
jgi:hypothetical protein